MPRQPIELVRPTFDAGFLAQAYSSGVQAGAAVGRNRVAMAEIASRERIASVDAALRARALSQQERLALEGMKNETEQFLRELEAKRADAAAGREFQREQLAEEYRLRRELQTTSPEQGMLKIRENQANAWDRIGEHLDKGGDINDAEISGDMARALAGSSALSDWMKAKQYQGGGVSTNRVGSFGRAMVKSGGDEVQARRIQARELDIVDSIPAMEELIQQLKENPQLISDPQAFSKLQQQYITAVSQLRAWQQETGEPPYEGLTGTNLMNQTQMKAYNDQVAREAEERKRTEEGSATERFMESLRQGSDLPWELRFASPYSGNAASRFLNQQSRTNVIDRNTPVQGPVTNNVSVRLLQPSGPAGVRLRATTNTSGAFRVQ